MSPIERYRDDYEYEKDCNQKMLAMLGSVPEAGQADARFQRAVTIAAHLAACRENWLNFMDKQGRSQVAWWDKDVQLDTLPARFAALESRWTDYLARLTNDRLPQDFEFSEVEGEIYHVPLEVQIIQLSGHACYHRGQIALLVDQLGGETPDTDYADWWWNNLQKKE